MSRRWLPLALLVACVPDPGAGDLPVRPELDSDPPDAPHCPLLDPTDPDDVVGLVRALAEHRALIDPQDVRFGLAEGDARCPRREARGDEQVYVGECSTDAAVRFSGRAAVHDGDATGASWRLQRWRVEHGERTGRSLWVDAEMRAPRDLSSASQHLRFDGWMIASTVADVAPEGLDGTLEVVVSVEGERALHTVQVDSRVVCRGEVQGTVHLVSASAAAPRLVDVLGGEATLRVNGQDVRLVLDADEQGCWPFEVDGVTLAPICP